YTRALALPIEVYGMTQRLNTITNYGFSYPDAADGLFSRRQATSYPEAQLISLVVVATKLLFPFDSDSVKRYPKHPNDPTTMCMSWTSWLEAKSTFDNSTPTVESNSLKPGAEITITDANILSMTDAQLDQYMDWYQRTWIKPALSQQESQETN